MDLICIDGKFSADVLEFYKQYKVTFPVEDKIYTMRDFIINSTGENGILLQEIVNPKVPIKHPILGIAEIEPNWNIKRFANLNGTEVTTEQLNEITREGKTLKV